MEEDLLQVRSIGVNFYVLRDSHGLYLIDGGFVGGRAFLRRALRAKGWDRDPIKGIVVTHGHLDHILNVSRISEETGAWIAAPRLDVPHYEGRPMYSGASRVTGCLEAVGRPLLGFNKFTPTQLLDDGDFLEIWDGLTVIHLPGHTAGHSGFYCESRKLLFSSDLFASYQNGPQLPPGIFNSSRAQIPQSVSKALKLDLLGVLPNHCDRSSPEMHLARLAALDRRLKESVE